MGEAKLVWACRVRFDCLPREHQHINTRYLSPGPRSRVPRQCHVSHVEVSRGIFPTQGRRRWDVLEASSTLLSTLQLTAVHPDTTVEKAVAAAVAALSVRGGYPEALSPRRPAPNRPPSLTPPQGSLEYAASSGTRLSINKTRWSGYIGRQSVSPGETDPVKSSRSLGRIRRSLQSFEISLGRRVRALARSRFARLRERLAPHWVIWFVRLCKAAAGK